MEEVPNTRLLLVLKPSRAVFSPLMPVVTKSKVAQGYYRTVDALYIGHIDVVTKSLHGGWGVKVGEVLCLCVIEVGQT